MNDVNDQIPSVAERPSKLLVLIPLFFALCPLFFIGLGFFIFDNGCNIQVNNYSKSSYRLLILSDVGVILDKQIMPLERNPKIIKLYRWQEVIIKIKNENKQTVYMNTYNYLAFEHQYQETNLGDRIYTINIPDDKYLEKIMPLKDSVSENPKNKDNTIQNRNIKLNHLEKTTSKKAPTGSYWNDYP